MWSKTLTRRTSSALTRRLYSDETTKPADWNDAKPYDSLPGPKPLPLLGNAWRFLIGPMSLKQDILVSSKMQHKTYGNIWRLTNLGILADFVFIYEPIFIEKLYRNEGPWPVRDGFHAVKQYRTVLRKDIFGDTGSLLSEQHEPWYKFRSTVNPVLMQPRVAEQYISTMNGIADDFLVRIQELLSKSPQSEMPDDFDNELNKWAFESIGFVALDRRLGCLDAEPSEEAQTMITYMVQTFKLMHVLDFTPLGPIMKKYNFGYWKQFVKYQDYFTDMALKYIDEATVKIENEEGYQDKPENEKSALEKLLKKDKKIAVVMILDMLTAGIDTTAKLTGALLYFLAKNKPVQETLRDELLRLLPTKQTPITKQVLGNAPYLKAVIKETARFAPVASGNFRLTTKDLVLGGYQIPSGVNVIIPNLYLSMNEDHYPRAGEFIPERWLRSNTGELSYKHVNPFVTLPFGFGPRSCVGRRLANLEIEIITAKIVRNFYLDWKHADMRFVQEFLYGIKDPLKIQLHEIQD